MTRNTAYDGPLGIFEDYEGFESRIGANSARDMTRCMCHGEPEPHWIETPNNGPFRPCPICNPKGEKPRPTE